MDSTTWCRTPADAPAASRFRVAVWKNRTDADARVVVTPLASITATHPARAVSSPRPAMMSTPIARASTTGSCPSARSAATTCRPTTPGTSRHGHAHGPASHRAQASVPRILPSRRRRAGGCDTAGAKLSAPERTMRPWLN